MMRATQGAPKIDTLISVQGAYPIRITDAGVLTCDDVIKVPLGYVAKRQTVIDKGNYNIIPVVELSIPIEYLVFEIITNEGATVEPFSTLKLPDEANPYNGVRIYFVLPPGTTGIKDVIFKPKYPGMRAVLQFEVLPPPYNYDNALFGIITSAVSVLDGRVDALENKKTYYGYIRNNGSHSIDFSKPGSTFIIKPDTRFIVFAATNASSENVSFEITLTSVRDGNIHTKSTLNLPSGRSTIKIDLQSLEMYVMSTDNMAKNVYNISGIQDSYYGGIKFGYNHNQNLTGNVEVHEWA